MPLTHYDDEPLAAAFVNTHDVTLPRPEHLPDPDALERFLRRWGLPPGRQLTSRDLSRARVLRRRLRAVFEAPDEERAAGLLNELLTESRVVPVVERGPGTGWVLRSRPATRDPIARLQAAAVTSLAELVEEHGFADLKTCDAAPCQDAFVDISRNGSRRFCCLACANRHRVAAFRRRAIN